MSPFRRFLSRWLLLLGALLTLLASSGCVFCSFLEYSNECCGACGTICGQVCVPLCVDTALGRGPFNQAAAGSFASGEHAAPLPSPASQPTPVAY